MEGQGFQTKYRFVAVRPPRVSKHMPRQEDRSNFCQHFGSLYDRVLVLNKVVDLLVTEMWRGDTFRLVRHNNIELVT